MSRCDVPWCAIEHDDVLGWDCHQRELLSADLGLAERVTTWLAYVEDTGLLTIDVEGLASRAPSPAVEQLQLGEARELAELLARSADLAEQLTGRRVA